MKTLIKVVGILALILLAVFLSLQLIPVQRDNPPVVTQVQWDSPETQALFRRACADCHSNETRWPWYSYVAPVSWLVTHDVIEGREAFNFSNLEAEGGELSEEIEHHIQNGEMPLPPYLLMHPEARLTPQEKRALISGLQATLSKMGAAQ